MAGGASLAYNFDDRNPLDQIIQTFKALRLRAVPGEEFQPYCTHPVVLAYLIELITGQTYQEFVQTAILDPLALNDTGFVADEPGLSPVYSGKTRVGASYIWESTVDACWGLVSTVEDLYRWERALDSGELVPAERLSAMFTGYISVPEANLDRAGVPADYGYGWVIMQLPDRQIHYKSTSGDFAPGRIARYPDEDVTMILLSNQQDTPLADIWPDLEGMVFGQD